MVCSSADGFVGSLFSSREEWQTGGSRMGTCGAGAGFQRLCAAWIYMGRFIPPVRIGCLLLGLGKSGLFIDGLHGFRGNKHGKNVNHFLDRVTTPVCFKVSVIPN